MTGLRRLTPDVTARICADGDRASGATGACKGLERVIRTEPLFVREGVGVMVTAWPSGARIRMAAEGRAGVMMEDRMSAVSPEDVGVVARQMVMMGSAHQLSSPDVRNMARILNTRSKSKLWYQDIPVYVLIGSNSESNHSHIPYLQLT